MKINDEIEFGKKKYIITLIEVPNNNTLQITATLEQELIDKYTVTPNEKG